MNRRRWSAAGLGVALLLSSASQAIAASGAAIEAQDSRPGSSDSSAGTETSSELHLEDIIVMARRTAENQQNVPVAVSTISGEALSAPTVSSIADIQRLVPSLQITSNSENNIGVQSFVIRGSFGQAFGDPGVVTYVDEVPIDARSLVYGIYDLGSVQELKGAQGTLFGKNSTGGAVLFFSRRPEDTFGGYADVRYGRYNDLRLEAALNVPVNDKLAFRIAGTRQTRDGVVKSVTLPGKDYGDRDNYSVRLSALWNPSEAIENYTQITHYRVRQTAMPTNITGLPISPAACTGVATPSPICAYLPPFNGFLGTPDVSAYLAQQLALPRDRTVNNADYRDSADYDAITNTTTIDLGGATVKNIAHFDRSASSFQQDYDGTPAGVLYTDFKPDLDSYYEELQLYGTAMNDRLNWRIGGTYSLTEGDQDFDQVNFEGLSPATPQINTNKSKATSKALFAQVSFKLMENLTATAGYRYTWDTRSAKIKRVQGATLTCGLFTTDTDPATCTRTLRRKFKDDNYNFTLDWKPIDRLLIYASARKGYKSGGFNTTARLPSLTSFEGEVVKDLEAGLKSDFRLGGIPIRLNAAAFQSKYDGIQSSAIDVDPVTGQVAAVTLNGNPVTGASNKATIKGYEIEVAAAPTAWLNLSAFYSKIRAKYTQFSSIIGTPLDGENVAGVIPETFGVTATVDIPLSPSIGALQIGSTYYSAGPTLSNSTSVGSNGRRNQIDLRADLRDLGGLPVDFGAYGKNLSGNRNCSQPSDFGPNVLVNKCGIGAEYGVSLRYRFGGK